MPWSTTENWYKNFITVDNMKKIGQHQCYKDFSTFSEDDRTEGKGGSWSLVLPMTEKHASRLELLGTIANIK